MEDPERREIVTEDTRGTPVVRRQASTSGQAGVPTGYSFRAVHLIWLATGIVDALIAIRFVLKALGASQASSFVTFMYGITDPLLAPFRGIFPVAAARGGSVLEPAAVVAFIIYLLAGWGVVALIRIVTTPRGTRTMN